MAALSPPFRGGGRPWHKRVLVPFWIVQLVCIIILLTVSIINAITINDNTRDGVQYGASVHSGHVLWAMCVSGVGMFICIILNILEMVMFARHRLHPRKYFTFQIIEAAIWTIIFLIYIVRLVHAANNKESYDDYLFDEDDYKEFTPYSLLIHHWNSFRRIFFGGDIAIIILFLAFTAPFMYAIMIRRRCRYPVRLRLRRTYTGDGTSPTANDDEPPQYELNDMMHRPESIKKTKKPIRGLELDGEGGYL